MITAARQDGLELARYEARECPARSRSILCTASRENMTQLVRYSDGVTVELRDSPAHRRSVNTWFTAHVVAVNGSSRIQYWTDGRPYDPDYPDYHRQYVNVAPRLVRAEFPRMVFAVVRLRSGLFRHLFARDVVDDGPLGPDSLVLKTRVSNSGWRVCLGSAEEAVIAGRLDPVEAFWNTAFDYAWPEYPPPPTSSAFLLAPRIDAAMMTLTHDPAPGKWETP